MKTNQPLKSVLAALAFAPCIVSAEPATAPDQAAELAKKLNNPVADLISVPFQNNFQFNVGSGNGFREVTNIQPVIPFELSEHWNLISRTILPVREQPVSIGLMGTWFAEAPSSAPDWGVRLMFTFLFPKG